MTSAAWVEFNYTGTVFKAGILGEHGVVAFRPPRALFMVAPLVFRSLPSITGIVAEAGG